MSAPDKTALRRTMTQRRAALTPVERAVASDAIRRHALALPELAAARRVALFASFGAEVDTHVLIDALLSRGREVALPCVPPNRDAGLVFRLIHNFPSDCRVGRNGILEPAADKCPTVAAPASLDLVFAPLLAFDAEGWRLGYGGGYYDRLLAEAPAVPALGLAFAMQRVARIPTEAWDRRLDAVVTETGVTRFVREPIDRE